MMIVAKVITTGPVIWMLAEETEGWVDVTGSSTGVGAGDVEGTVGGPVYTPSTAFCTAFPVISSNNVSTFFRLKISSIKHFRAHWFDNFFADSRQELCSWSSLTQQNRQKQILSKSSAIKTTARMLLIGST
jgi:hypothetical protein